MSRDDKENVALLSSKAYDEDANSVPSNDAYDSDEETRDDSAIFEEDCEHIGPQKPATESKSGRLADGDSVRQNARSGELGEPRRPSRRHRERRKRRDEQQSELMYEMEEGGKPSESSSRSSSESDLQRLSTAQVSGASRRKHRFGRVMIYVAITLLFLVFLFGAYRATRATHHISIAGTFSNGTSSFPPTTILISLDGFRADFLQRGLTPTLNAFIAEGVSPIYMLPSFPSVTFPNHYTLVTGLYPESHGIVGNTFWDPELQDEFYYTHTTSSMQSKWWGGEPLWVTAELQDVKTAIHMWPGSEAHIMEVEPSHLDQYNGKEPLDNKVDRILGLIDLPGPESPRAMTNQPRPQLIAAYVPIVDVNGHLYGPNSTETRQSINDVDTMLAAIFIGLEQRNLTDVVNVVVVSDHGMATTDASRLMQLEDLVNTNDIEHIDGWPLFGLRPKKPEDLDRLYKELKAKTRDNPNVEVYLRDKDMPERYHFSRNPRIAPLWLIPKTGWAIVTKSDFDVAAARQTGQIYHPRGLHGYDHEHPLMRSIFVARGPAFPHSPGSRVDVFQNTEVYNIVCDSIGIAPRPNNGTLRLPLKPVGLHADPGAPKADAPDDPPTHGGDEKPGGEVADAAVGGSETEASLEPAFSIATAPANPLASTSSASHVTRTTVFHGDSSSETSPAPSRPTIANENDGEEGPTRGSNAWQWIADKWEATRKKLDSLFKGKDGSSG